MKNLLLFNCFFLFGLQAYAQIYQFGDTANFTIRTLGIELTDGLQQVDLDCNGTDDLAFEVLFNDSPPQLRRTAIYLLSPDSVFDVAVLETYKVKNFKKQDTIQCVPPDEWTNFPFLVIGISGNGGTFGNCCFDNEYIGFRHPNGPDTLAGWIKISTTLFPAPKIIIHEIGYRGNCPLLGAFENTATSGIKISPNPFNNFIQVTWEKSANEETERPEWICIYNAMGKLLIKTPVHFSEMSRIDVSGIPPGIYFVQIGNYQYKLIK